MSKRGCFFEGLLLGSIIGGLIGILYAPQSGDETRAKLRQIKEDNEDLIQDTKDKTETLIDKTKEAIEQGFEKLSTIIERNKGLSSNEDGGEDPKGS